MSDTKTVQPEAVTDTAVKQCPNCTRPINEESAGCVLHSLMVALKDRETLDEAELESIHVDCNVDVLWEAIGSILDDMEQGRYGGDMKKHDDDEGDDDDGNDDEDTNRG